VHTATTTITKLRTHRKAREEGPNDGLPSLNTTETAAETTAAAAAAGMAAGAAGAAAGSRCDTSRDPWYVFFYSSFIILLTNFLVRIDDDDGMALAASPALSPPFQRVKTRFPPPNPSLAQNVSRRGVSSFPLPTTTPLLPPSLEKRDRAKAPVTVPEY
jgi:hypothetical protein